MDKMKIAIAITTAVVIALLTWVFTTTIQRINGNTPEQLEAEKRAQEAMEETSKAMHEATQWYRDLEGENSRTFQGEFTEPLQ